MTMYGTILRAPIRMTFALEIIKGTALCSQIVRRLKMYHTSTLIVTTKNDSQI